MQSTLKPNKFEFLCKNNKILPFLIWVLSIAFGIGSFCCYFNDYLKYNHMPLSIKASYAMVLYALLMLLMGLYISIKLICNLPNRNPIQIYVIYVISLFCSLVPLPCGLIWIILLFNNAKLIIILISLIFITFNFPICYKFIKFYDKSNTLLSRFYLIWLIITNISMLALMQFGNFSEFHYMYTLLVSACICTILLGLAMLFKITMLCNIAIYVFLLYNILLTFMLWVFASVLFLPPILIFMITNFYVSFKLLKRKSQSM